MKKLIVMLIFLFIVYLGIQFAFVYFGKGENYSYEITKDGLTIGIDETSTFRVNNSFDNYYFDIHVNNTNFLFQINHDFNKLTQVITDVEYFKNDNYECILPIFKGNLVITDVLCYNGNEYTYYYNLVGIDNDLDRFVKGIKLYDITKWQDNATSNNIENIDIYKDNLIKNHYIGFTNYKGIYNISANFNSTVYNIGLYNSDVRNQKIGIFVDNYYISADYNEEYEFNKFNVVDLVELKTSTFASNTKISMDSYIEGVADGYIYLYDKDSEKQYKININKKDITEPSSTIKQYNNGEWSDITPAVANTELKFVTKVNDYQDDKYDRIDKVGDKVGYYYLYQMVNNKYNVYRMNIQDKKTITYLFTTNTIQNICYADDYVYFISDADIKVYNDEFGVKKIASYNELEFNQNINFNVYVE